MTEDKGPLFDAVTGAFSRLKPVDLEKVKQFQELCRPENLTSAFQPIFRSVTGELEGCEALLRLPAGTLFGNPAEAFHDSARLGFLLPLESAAIRRHLADARSEVGDRLLFLNVAAPLFSDPNFGVSWLVARMEENALRPEQVVLEIPEILRIRDFTVFHRHLEPFRAAGFRIAIDDFGAGYTNLRMITDLSPDFVKVDRVFIDGIASHARKRVLVESVVTLCHRVNCRVIAEGIELPDDLEPCLAAGVDLLQGFLFARPTRVDLAFSAAEIALPDKSHRPLPGQEIRHLLFAEEPLGDGATLGDAAARFAANPRLKTLPLTSGRRATGLLHRPDVDALLAAGTPATAPVRDVMASAWERISDTALVEEATERVRRRPEDQRFDPLVVVGPDQSYRGLLPIDALLFELSRLKVEFALQSNPVTRLPGRPFFEPVVAQRLELHEPFVVGRLNLLRFKAFNDRYGFLRGDDLLVRVASLLRGEIGPLPGAIVAHFANDDFAYIAPMENAEENGLRLLASFEEIVRQAHDADDVSGAGFVVKDRRGEPRTLPLVGLAIGLVPWSGEDAVGLRALLQTAESTLQGARSSGASKVLMNRRDLATASRISAEHPVLAQREGPPPRDE